ncbi:hypothetical protein OS493_012784 [Desmophyllum pertusum]|uniref:G-protein coupled receptors family 1 profile domain-containing protein n=1 Tax=Desmophyllum pertusum TaxID=174260 RepID=A0A9X0CXX2_9CNID|nr:hypothetical protein OS493_012784 [Desmophyllum pertusum]
MEEGQNGTANTNTTPVAVAKMKITELAIITVLYCLLVVTIITGNGLILTSFAINRKLRTVTNTFIISLSISDTLVGFVSIPCWIYIFLCQYTERPYTNVGYQFYITFDIFIGSASILQLTSISIERCHAIVRPLRHRTLSMRVFYAMIAIPWVYAAIMASLQPVQFERWTEVYTVLMTTTCFFIPFIIILVAYVTIYVYARARPTSMLTRHRMPKKAYKNEIRLSATVALITVLFVIAWLPLFVVSVMATYYPQNLPPSPLGIDRLLKFVKFCHYSNSALNPFVYAYRNKQMINTFRYIGYKLLCKEHSLQLPLMSTGTSFIKSTYQRKTWQGSSRNGNVPETNKQAENTVMISSV